MKNILLVILLASITLINSQTKEERQAILDARKNGTELSIDKSQEEYEGYYALVLATGRLFSKKVTISIDYGKQTRFFQNTTERDENGKPIVFNTVVDALNYMKHNGWDFVDAYAITIGNQNVYHYLFERSKDETN